MRCNCVGFPSLVTCYVRRICAGVGILLLLATLVDGARAAEEILRFHSDIAVQTNGDLIVTEKISVRAEGREIRRGIYRDFPLAYTKWGMNLHVGFEILSLSRNGKAENYHTEPIRNGVRIYFGESSTEISRGTHTYVFEYRTSQQLRYFEDYDEVYWNVTGDRWRFPIREASATVRLPEGADVVQTAAHMGKRGARGGDIKQLTTSAGHRYFASQRLLAPGEGLTIAVGFSKKAVAPASFMTTLIGIIAASRGALALGVGTLVVFMFYLISWHHVGRDPQGGTIIPLFRPPEGLSPAQMAWTRHIHQMVGADDVGLTAALVNLAIKGYVKIDNSGEDLVLLRQRDLNGNTDDLAKEERILAQYLFDGKGGQDGLPHIVFSEANSRHLAFAQTAFNDDLSKDPSNANYFRNNSVIMYIGGAISLATLIAFAFFSFGTGETLATLLFFCIILLATCLLGSQFATYLSGSNKALKRILLALVVVAAFGGTWLFTIYSGRAFGEWALAASLVLMNVFFLGLISAPTHAGRRLLDHIEGFKLYLETAEADRMNMTGAPRMSSGLFEKYLPYAIALGVEKPWSERFAAWMKRIGEAEDSYRPRWSSGRFRTSGLASTVAAMSSAVSTGFDDAASMQRSGSGGGSAGGGGGGGGGGGW